MPKAAVKTAEEAQLPRKSTRTSVQAVASTEHSDSQLETRPRQSPRCTKCPGRPLRSQCIHTKQGEIYLLEQAAIENLRAVNPLHPMDPLPTTQPAIVPVVQPVMQGGVTATVNVLPKTAEDSPSMQGTGPIGQSGLPLGDNSIHPEGGTSITPPSDQSHIPRLEPRTTLLDDSLLAHSPSENIVSASLPAPTKPVKPVRRTSARNPYNDYVKGVKRGNDTYHIVRGHAAPAPILETSKAVKQFSVGIQSIIEKCDDLSRQTGCWLFLGAQHSTARTGALTYVSPRLRTEAASQAGEIATQFSITSRNLINAHIQSNINLQQQVDQTKREAELLQRSLESASRTQEDLTAQLERYKAAYGLFPSTSA